MTEVLIAASVILTAGYAALMLFYYSGWVRTPLFMPGKNSPKTKVSVVVAARNEQENIERCIHSILQQDYPRELLEVIVVDDHSQPGIFTFLTSFESSVRAGSLKCISNSAIGKKAAIETGIKRAAGELIITTDADCVAQRNWIATVVAFRERFQPKMIAAPVAFTNEKSWLEKWQSLDLCGMMAITAGAITNGFPNMCNGANLAYEKKVFEEIGGFTGINKQPGGDDVMLMQKLAKKYPGGVHFLKSKEAVVFTQTEKTLSGLFQQRLRWLSKGTAFPDWRVSAVLVFSWLFNLSVLGNFIAGFFQKEFWLIAAISFLIKSLSELPLLAAGCSFFGKEKLLWNILPAGAIHILYVVIAGGLSRLLPVKWKGRVYSKRVP